MTNVFINNDKINVYDNAKLIRNIAISLTITADHTNTNVQKLNIEDIILKISHEISFILKIISEISSLTTQEINVFKARIEYSCSSIQAILKMVMFIFFNIVIIQIFHVTMLIILIIIG